CEAETEVMITENILPLSVTIQQVQPIRCAGVANAILEATPKGGKPPYQYIWSNDRTTAGLSDLAAGTYRLTVTDAAGQTSQVEYRVQSPEALTVSVLNLRPATNDRISDGKATVEARGGFGAYQIAW